MLWKHTVISGPFRVHQGNLLVEARGVWCSLQEVLDYYGSQEWELISVDMMETTQEVACFFKRAAREAELQKAGPGIRPDPNNASQYGIPRVDPNNSSQYGIPRVDPNSSSHYGIPRPDFNKAPGSQAAASSAQAPSQQGTDSSRRRRSLNELNSLLRGPGRRPG